ncbi:hypothetical protein M758_3G173500 [Ceratodon purpureus]|uniref:Core-2/I-branching beta-1,6-N-acetylglucosaminyltransferase family protein n=1 Tax=Ceratodon purpureus TaxID=3225 RepID=A0A8T0ILQ0_CERPU|nr:hypothetical protein KC19_3G174700 [Ceratodon purpureus]KAG0623414.1 hypothetical protein M758_3G173500 [Ceratodon purpureus]KAG0623415.1 hypothetical protein M758_3G173500 [Ceratodon purpureus]KAG0623416.1 hypothetical protein M758_3G173500 [Ceratodon purpureus]KAG0623417.1 hypothetical protein M758_3G173500 [Ceratodon purpureus]
MKSRSHGSTHSRGHSRYKWILITFLIVVLVLGILFILQSLVPELEPPISSTPFPTVSRPKEPASKIAFLFLVRHQMPLDFVWEHFFQGAGEDEYTVYIHARPKFLYTENTTKCSAFIDRQLKEPVLVEWGEASMLQAERLLLKEALQDPLNQRFILLSDSCVPIYNFRFIYDYVMFSQKSFVDSFTDPRDVRYNHKMAPAIWKDKWRKGSQWFVLIRKHAVEVVKDSTVFPVFQRYCKKMALPEFTESSTTSWNHNCIPDEHYLPTLLAMRNMETEIERRSVTYSQWKSALQHTMDRRGWHPITFDASKTTLKAIKDIQDINEIHFVAASRRERCGSGGKALPCYLFARKFTRGAGVRLLELAPDYEHRDLPY